MGEEWVIFWPFFPVPGIQGLGSWEFPTIPDCLKDSVFQDSQILGNMKALLLEESPAFLEAPEGADLDLALGWLS